MRCVRPYAPFDFAVLRSGRAIAVPIRAECNLEGEVEAWAMVTQMIGGNSSLPRAARTLLLQGLRDADWRRWLMLGRGVTI